MRKVTQSSQSAAKAFALPNVSKFTFVIECVWQFNIVVKSKIQKTLVWFWMPLTGQFNHLVALNFRILVC